MDVLLIIFLCAIFGISHTLLASNKIKKKLVETIGDKIAFYRLFYNLSSILILFAILEIAPKPQVVIYDLEFPFDIVIFGIQISALIGFIWTIFYFDGMEFLGVKQVKRYLNNSFDVENLDEKKSFVVKGPFKYSRHPLYFFSIVFLISRPTMNLYYLTMTSCAIIYFIIGAIYEERKLAEEFGEEYKKYQRDVAFLIPYKVLNLGERKNEN